MNDVYADDMPVSAATMPALLAHHVHTHGDAIAFIEGERAISYREFDRQVTSTAAWLVQHGVQPGDRVAVWLVNRMEWLAMYFGLARIGAAMMTLNTRYRSHELADILDRSQASMLVLQLGFRKIDFPAVLRDVPPHAARALRSVAVVDANEHHMPPHVLGRPTVAFTLADLPDADTPDVSRPDATSILFTTSGTTSAPKLVMHPQRTVTLHALRTARAYGVLADDARLLAALPFSGVFGFNSLMCAFAAGRPVIVMDTFDGAEAAALIQRHRITHVFGSDEMFQRVIEHATSPDVLASARMLGFGNFQSHGMDDAQAAWQRGIPMFGLYGSSEVQALFSVQRMEEPVPERVKGGGMPASRDHGAHIRIRDLDSGALLGPGASGALEIRADTNFIGYLNDPEATAKAIDADGYFRTGDIAYLRDDGSFVYVARQGDAMRLSGYLVSPAEIENVIRQTPGVQEVQVVAVEIGKQLRPVAFVIAATGSTLSETELKAAAQTVLAAFKVPAHFWIEDAFPTTQSANGNKIQRAKLRALAQQRVAAGG